MLEHPRRSDGHCPSTLNKQEQLTNPYKCMNISFHNTEGRYPAGAAGYAPVFMRCMLRIKHGIFLLLLLLSPCFAGAQEQTVTLNVKDAPLEQVMAQLRRQTGYNFVYGPQAKEKAKNVTLSVQRKPLKEVLELIFKDQELGYTLSNKSVIITTKAQRKAIEKKPTHGTVYDEDGKPLAGATIRSGTLTVTTDADGNFTLPAEYENAAMQVSYLGYTATDVKAKDGLTVTLHKKASELDQVMVIAYGTTTRRLSTGSVSKISADEITKQPAANVLGVLSGRIPGLEVNQSNGSPGSSFSMQIRGRNSITQGSAPLILIDGIPYAAGNDNINTLISPIGDSLKGGGLSPFFSINPANIESIEVLKDADATAIYGSRGANGVILITTKKGEAGDTRISANFSQGFSRAPQGMPMMNTEQYLDMRREAFKNSNVTPTATNAPDLTQWDQSRYTDLRKELTGNSAQNTNAQLSLSGGSAGTQFLVGGAYYRETLVFPGSFPNSRGSMNASLNHSSANGRLRMQFAGSYTAATNTSAGTDLTYYTFLPPNIPSFFDATGNLNWVNGFQNPYAYLFNTYKATTGNLMGSLNLSYRILPALSIKTLLGYNQLNSNDEKFAPKTSRDPSSTQQSRASFGNMQLQNWNLEPQIEYNNKVGPGQLNVLVGTTLQQKNTTGSSINLTDFPSDALLQSMQAGATVTSKSNTNVLYRYQALFGRANYNIANRYLLNITGRRDGSSRFGPGQRFANFGAVGAAWIFSTEKWLNEQVPFLSYGKLRGSYGVTGNDQIGDYQYLDSWQSISGNTYQGITALFPSFLYNPIYAWEKNKKLEAALELGFLQNRLLLNLDYFRNRSGNQLVKYKLPYTTGFASMLMNFPALVQNTGWEISLMADVLKSTNLKWTANFNLTLPKNTLLEFPDIETSSYRSQYVIGQPLNVIYNYRSQGVNPQTGLYTFVDVNNSGTMSSADYLVNGSLDPKYYGGLRNNVQYKGWALDLFFDFKKQTGKNYLQTLYLTGSGIPGTINNQPVVLLGRWQNIGDNATAEKFVYTASPNRANVIASNVVYSDQSYIRLRSIQLSYSFSPPVLQAIGAKNASIYVQGQNLHTWNKDKGYDPEVQNLNALAPVRTYMLGIQFTY